MSTRAALVSCLVVGVIACSSSTDSSPAEPADPCAASDAAATVSATDNFVFSPGTDTITVGQSVCWQNTGRLVHTVTESPNAIRFNATLPENQAFIYTFGFGGTFSYRCTNHSTMTGIIVVKCRPGELSC